MREGEKSEGKRRVTVGDSSSFRRQRGLRRRPVSVQGSPLLKGKDSDGSSDFNDITVDSNNEQNNESGKDSGRFTDSERGSPTGGSRRKQLGARGAELVRQVRRLLGKTISESMTTKTPVKDTTVETFAVKPDIPVRTLRERPSSTCTPIRNVKREATSTPVSSTIPGGKENRNRVVIQLGSELPGWRGPVGHHHHDQQQQQQQERRKSFTSTPRRSRGSIETDSCGTVTVPVPFIQPPGPWL